MAWFEAHQSLVGHPKTRKAARLLNVSRPTVIGHLFCLWSWALDYAQDGDVSGYSPEDLATGAEWDGEADALVEALADCGYGGGAGFLERTPDGRLLIHDWWEYAGKLIQKRREDAQRKREGRRPDVQNPPSFNSAPVHSPSNGHPSDGAGTDRQTDRQTDKPTSAGAGAPRKAGKPSSGISLAPLFDAFRAMGKNAPSVSGQEARAASALLKEHDAALIVQCWLDHKGGTYPAAAGDAFSQRDLSYSYLATRNRFGNWLEWHEAGRPPAAPRHSGRPAVDQLGSLQRFVERGEPDGSQDIRPRLRAVAPGLPAQAGHPAGAA